MHFAEIATSISAPSTPRPRENQDEKSFKVMNQAFDDVERKTFTENWDSKAQLVGTLMAYLKTTA